MTNQKLTLEIPEFVFERFHHLAELTGQSIESLVLQSITSNLPCLNQKGHDLDELLSQVTADNLHDESL
jgi:antitoxin MazE